MRILIDMQGAQTESRYRGIGRYTMSFVRALVRNNANHEIILLLSDFFPESVRSIRSEFEGVLPASGIRVWGAPGPVREMEADNGERRAVAENIREAFIATLAPDVIHLTSLFEGYVDDGVVTVGAAGFPIPVTITLYDLIPYLYQDKYLENEQYRTHYLRKIESLDEVTAFLAISEFSRIEGWKTLRLKEDLFHNVSCAIDDDFARSATCGDIGDLRKRVGIQREFVLYTGGADGRKNLERLVEAYAHLPALMRENHQLVLAGRISEAEAGHLLGIGISHGLSSDDFVFTGYIEDSDLATLYRECACFIFPSWHEGFGLPALEAMSCGAPVIGAGASSLVEVIDLEEAMFDPFNVDDIVEKLERCLGDEDYRQRLRRHGLGQSHRFSWDETAIRAFAVWDGLEAQVKATVRSMPPLTVDKKRLAFFSPLPPERSGIADYSVEILEHLSDIYQIDVFVDQGDVNCVLPQGVSVQSIRSFEEHASDYERIVYQVGNSQFHKHMPGLMRRYPGVTVLHDFYLGSLLQWCETALGWSGVWDRALYDSHGYPALIERRQDPECAKRRYPASFEVVRDSVGVIVHSSYSKWLLEAWYGSASIAEVVRQPRAIPGARAEKPTAKYRVGVPEQAFLVCSFGFLDSSKLNHLLIEAWSRSKLCHDRDCYLVFVGENHGGSYGASLLEAIRALPSPDRVRITGFADAALYRDFLSAADLGVQLRTASRGETSAAVLDCLSRGVPLVVNANGTMAELNQEAVLMLPDAFAIEELVGALEQLRSSPEVRSCMGEAGLREILQNHAPAGCAEHYRDAIESFYASRRAAWPALLSTLEPLVKGWSDESVGSLAGDLVLTFPEQASARRLLLDVTATAAHDLKTGIERVARAILVALASAARTGLRVEPVRLSTENGSWCYRYARRYACEVLGIEGAMLGDDVVDPTPGDTLLTLDISGETLVQSDRSGLLDLYRRRGVRTFATLFDLLPVRMPHVFPPRADEGHTRWLECVANMHGAVCISQSVADDMREWLRDRGHPAAERFQLFVTHLGADLARAPTGGFSGRESAQAVAAMAERPTFLMVGTIEPRKGYAQTLEAFELLWARGVEVNLVIVGREGWRGLPDDQRRDIPSTTRALLGHVEKGHRLFWLSDASDGDLEQAYRSATCLLAASYGEGFGLPLIEAAEHGLALLVRDIPVFREVARASASYFTAATPEAMADAVAEWLDLYERGRYPRSLSLRRTSWERMSRELLTVLGFEAGDHRAA